MVRKYGKTILLAMTLLAAMLFGGIACGGDKGDPSLTFFVDNKVFAEVSGKEGSAVAIADIPEKEGYVFDGWYDNERYEGTPVVTPAVMPKKSVTYYGRYVIGRKINYVANYTGVQTVTPFAPTVGKIDGAVSVRDGKEFGVTDYLFVGWSDKENGTLQFSNGKSEGQYNAGEEITLTQDITLYAQWAKGYSDIKEQNAASVYVYEPLIDGGMGGAFLVRAGQPDKMGFAKLDTQNNAVEFTFYFEQSEGGDVVGHVLQDGYVLRDETYGSYLQYDYITNTPQALIMTSDGYGNAIFNEMIGDQMHVAAFGKYVYDKEYADYTFMSSGVERYELHFVLQRQAIDGNEKLNGYFMLQGEESGSYLLYGNGELYSYRLDLFGYGNAKLYVYNPQTQTEELLSVGEYRGTDDYEDVSGEWIYTPDSQYEDGSFRFMLSGISSNDGITPIYIEYDATMEKTLMRENNPAETLALSGYGTAVYTTGAGVYEGHFVYDEKTETITLSAYTNNGGTMESAGRLYFTVNWANESFTVNTEGYILDGTRLVDYKGSSRVIEVPENVTEIAADVFSSTHIELSVVSVTIPASVQSIGARAFQNDYTLRRVVFMATKPISIDWSSANDPFRWGAGDLIIVVPEGSQEAYKAAWGSDCRYTIKGSQEVLVLPEFEVAGNVLVRYNKQDDAAELLDLKIPDGVTAIAPHVFRGIDYVRSVDLNDVTTVGAGAFENCLRLQKVLLPNVTDIGEGAFLGCAKLATSEDGTSVLLLPKAESVGANAFQGCESLRVVRFGATLRSIGDGAFAECQIYEDEDPLFIELSGTDIPAMGAKIGVGNIAMRIRIQDISVAKKCFAAPDWNAYIKHLYIPSGEEKGLYLDGSDTLQLDGRAVLLSSAVYLYEIENTRITFYDYDSETATVSEIVGTIRDGIITVTAGGKQYRFKKAGDTATYTSEDGKYTFTCDPKTLDPEYYGGETGYADVVLNGTPTKMRVGYRTHNISKFLDSDGIYYDFVITLSGDTFTYTKTRSKLENMTASDGSVLNLRFTTYGTIYVYGTLKIDVGNGNNLTFSDGGTMFSWTDDHTGTFTYRHASGTYVVTVTFNSDFTAFTYTFTKQ